jgi:superfamily II DNA or RNA helicase
MARPPAGQLALDFSASTSQRMRRSKARATEQPSMFAYAANIDVHLHTPRQAVADVAGPEPERARPWLEKLVGPVQAVSARRLLFPTSALDRLLHVVPPAHVTLDASSLAVARALWADKLGLRPLKVTRHRQRLLASSSRWPTGLGVADAPWPAIATLTELDIPFDVEAKAKVLLTDKLGQAGTHVAHAGLAGSAVVLEARRGDLLESLNLPALAYHGGQHTGRYRMPLLAASCLLDEPTVGCSDDLASAIKRANRRARPMATAPDFPWELYAFQARDAASAVRILESTGGVLLAGSMGSGKAAAITEEVLTPSGPVPIGLLEVGDEVLGVDGEAHAVTGVFPQGVRDLYRVSFSDGASLVVDGDHLWTVNSPDRKFHGRPPVVKSTSQMLDAGLRDGAGNAKWYLPMVEPLQFTGSDLPVPPYTLGALLGDGSTSGSVILTSVDLDIDQHLAAELASHPGLDGVEVVRHNVKTVALRCSARGNRATRELRSRLEGLGVWGCRSWEKFVPREYLYARHADRLALLQGLFDTDGYVCTNTFAAAEFTSTSEQLCHDVVFLAQSLGGTGRMSGPRTTHYTHNGERRADHPSWRVRVSLPAGTEPFRLERKASIYRGLTKYGPSRAIVSITPEPPGEAVCISVDSPDSCFVAGPCVVTHNTTIALALADQLELWPMLVVAPLAAFSTWQRQLSEMGRDVYLATDSPQVSWDEISKGHHDAVVLSYDRLHAFVELVEQQGFAAIVADEIQRIRTPSSRRSRALRALAHAVPVRIGLSGTPIANRIEELLPLGSFLVPGEWKPRATTRELAKLYPGDPVEAITDHLGTMMVRRRMEDTGAKLPHRHDHRVLVQLTPEQRRALLDLEAEAQRSKEEEGFTHLHAFVRLHKMRAIVSCPAVAGVSGPNPKLSAAIDLAEDFIASGRRGVIFCADRQMFRDLGAALDASGIGWVGIWGSTPIADRIANEQKFHADDNIKIVLATIQAASESVTFSPTATFLICTSYVYSPAALDQMEARIYRLNQTNEVDICYLHAQAPGGTLDDRIVSILAAKKEMIARVVDRRAHTDNTKVHYSLSDLVFLLTGSRDEALVAREADAQAAVDRELAAKRHARATAHRHKTGEFLDDGSLALTAEAYQALADAGLDSVLDDEDLAADLPVDSDVETFDLDLFEPDLDGTDLDGTDLDDPPEPDVESAGRGPASPGS